ncbi:MAG: hypothetical protein QOE25_1556 [Actinomycetota bacterium]|nr:hypothetical protein [Actinomycetota bacterium]
MDLAPYVEAIRGDLDALLTGDDAGRAALERVGRAIEPSLQIRLQDVLGEASLELCEQLPSGHAEVRVAGRDARIVYVGPSVPEPAAPEEPDEGGVARITLRVSETLKTKVEESAAKEGLSVNAWLVRAVQQGVEGRRVEFEIGRGRSGSRITGYAQS